MAGAVPRTRADLCRRGALVSQDTPPRTSTKGSPLGNHWGKTPMNRRHPWKRARAPLFKSGVSGSGTPPELSSRTSPWGWSAPSCSLKQPAPASDSKLAAFSKGRYHTHSASSRSPQSQPNGSAFLALLFIPPWSLGKLD